MTAGTIARKIITSVGLIVVGAASFRLSFDAQTKLAIASGVPADLAPLYPSSVDVAIAIAMLIVIWMPGLDVGLRRYVWWAVAIWSSIQIAGNALHILALDPDSITMPFGVALAVNSVPAITFFLIVHIAFTTVFRATPAPALVPVAETADIPSRPVGRRTGGARAIAAAPITDPELLALVDDEGLSYSEIADRIGRSKSWVGEHVKTAREALEATPADEAQDLAA